MFLSKVMWEKWLLVDAKVNELRNPAHEENLIQLGKKRAKKWHFWVIWAGNDLKRLQIFRIKKKQNLCYETLLNWSGCACICWSVFSHKTLSYIEKQIK